jgi:hypothetical protein
MNCTFKHAPRLGRDLDLAVWLHARLMKDISQPGNLVVGDDAAQWASDLPEAIVTMDAPDTKRAYGLLTVSVTRQSFGFLWLGGRVYDMVNSYGMVWVLAILLGVTAAMLHLPISDQPVNIVKTA